MELCKLVESCLNRANTKQVERNLSIETVQKFEWWLGVSVTHQNNSIIPQSSQKNAFVHLKLDLYLTIYE